MSFFEKLNDKLQNFMVGRNGSDRLARWSIGGALVFMVVNVFFSSIVFVALGYILLTYTIFRIFSKDTAAREREDERFSELLEKVAFWKRGGHSKDSRESSSKNASSHQSSKGQRDASKGPGSKQSDTGKGSSSTQDPSKMRISCEACGQSLSVPKGRGKLKVTCPKCHHQMKVDS